MIPQISDLKQINSEATKLQQKQQQQKKEEIYKIFDNSTYALSIVISDDEQNQSSQVLDSLSILLDNMQNQIETSQNERTFFKYPSYSIKKLYFRKMDSSILISSSNNSFQSFLESENSQRFIEQQINETQQLQMKQQLGNILLFDIQKEGQKYNECFLAACQSIKNSNKKIIFINLSGLDNYDNKYQYQFEVKPNYVYVNFKEFKQQKQSKFCCGQLYEKNFFNIYFNYGENQMFYWDQFKLIYRLHIKKLIKKVNSDLFILSIAKPLESKSSQRYIRFDDDCLQRIIEKFCKLAKNKLFIYLILLDSEETSPQELKYQTNDQDMIRFLNCIQQGAIGNKIKSKINFDLDKDKSQLSLKYIIWLQEFVNIQIKVKLDPIFLKMYQRELRNLLLNNTFIQSEEFLQESALMILNSKQIHKETNLYYEKKKLQFFFNSQLLVDYSNKLVVLLQQDEFKKNQYFLYYGEIQEDQQIIQCYRILLNEYIDDALLFDSQKKASLSVKNMRIIQNNQQFIYQKMVYIHSMANDIILEIQCFGDHKVRILKRNKDLDRVDAEKFIKQKSIIRDQSTISDLVKNRRGPYVVQNSPISETDFMIIGGEFQNDPTHCNIIEIVKLDEMAKSGFYSYILSKEVLFAKGSFVPWPYMLVLSSNQQPYQYIFLPGDYKNQINCYNKPIVNVYQYYAYQLTTLKDSFQFQWKKLNIIYDNSNLGNSQPFPIQYFSGNQSNVLCMVDSKITKWIIAKTINKQILFGSKGQKEFFKCLEDIDSNVLLTDIEQIIITAEIYINENNLIIKEKFYQTGKEVILQKKIVDFTNEDLILF
ncbi:unnamed protein product [Paramecium pentaurelia]|uniref:Uncharacterized protein n=1 Tax=Paramecium pentaurelia TaxID=43138 RepID=A0A8S1TA68_9CILI|nr:unnamed protein product [Paramecium pentaurelia]